MRFQYYTLLLPSLHVCIIFQKLPGELIFFVLFTMNAFSKLTAHIHWIPAFLGILPILHTIFFWSFQPTIFWRSAPLNHSKNLRLETSKEYGIPPWEPQGIHWIPFLSFFLPFIFDEKNIPWRKTAKSVVYFGTAEILHYLCKIVFSISGFNKRSCVWIKE